MDLETVRAYDRAAQMYASTRPLANEHRAQEAVERATTGPIVDLGCGPGYFLSVLDQHIDRAIGLDASSGLLNVAARTAPTIPLIQADLESLPFHDRSLGGAWARYSHMHLPSSRLPAALAELSRCLAPTAIAVVAVQGWDDTADGPGRAGPVGFEGTNENDDIPGRLFAAWRKDPITAEVAAAGLEIIRTDTSAPERPSRH